jgi:hypothetical protein
MSPRALLSRVAVSLRTARPGSLPLGARGYATKQPNATREFYKSFTRPVAKVLLLAVFTYQFAYWSWIKMEADEVRSERDATIASLEAKVAEYEKTVKPETKRN